MPTITKIEVQKKQRRFNIYLDKQFALGVGAGLLVQKSLKVGKEITLEELQGLLDESRVEKLYESALGLLGYRPRSKQEVRNKLWQKIGKLGVQKELRKGLIEQVLEKLEESSYLDDREFARWWVKERIRSRPRGRLLLRNELYEKGVAEEVIEQVLKRYSQEDEFFWAKKSLEKKERLFAGLQLRERQKKTVAHLQRLGFPWEIVSRMLEE